MPEITGQSPLPWELVVDKRCATIVDANGNGTGIPPRVHPHERDIADLELVVASVNATMKPAEGFEQGSYIVLSTAHMTPHSNSQLMCWAKVRPAGCTLNVAATDNGYWIGCEVAELAPGASMGSIMVCIDFARRQGFDFILFDSDGPKVDGLATYDW